jgi:hypothetical protein
MIKDRIKISILRRKLILSYFIISVLVIWLKYKFDDSSFYYEQNSILEYEIIEKDSIINSLNYKIKDIESKKKDTYQTKPLNKIINTKKTVEVEKVDSIKSEIQLITDTLENQ